MHPPGIHGVPRAAVRFPGMGAGEAIHCGSNSEFPWTVVLADELGSDAVLAGIRNARSWTARSAQIQLSFTIGSGASRAGIGERLDTALASRPWCGCT